MVRLEITQNPGLIGIDAKPSVFNMKNAPAQFQLRQTSAEVEVSGDSPAVKIDETEMRASMGYKAVVRLAKEDASRARRIALAAIGQKSKEGDTLGRIENKGNPIPAIAVSAAWPSARETNIGLMPSVPPRISFTGGIKVMAVPGKLQVDVQPNFSRFNIQQGYIRTYLQVKPSVEIKATGIEVDLLG